jgi:phage terminase Nu1 subunit (DNA packaging protein)
METEYLRQNQLAVRLKVSVQTIHAWHKQGLPCVHRAPQYALYELGEVLTWLRNRPGQTRTTFPETTNGATTKDRA